MEKNTFVFYKAWMDAIEGLPDEVRLEIYEAIIRYGTSGILSDLKPMARLAFNFVKADMDRDAGEYERICEQNRQKALGRWQRVKESPWQDATGCHSMQQHATACHGMPQHYDNDNDYDNDKKKKPTYVGKKEDAADAAALLEVREKRFYDSLVEYTAVYGAEMVRAFYDYWTEPNKSRTKMRFEQERTWDTARRLKAWAEREKEFIKNNNHGTDRKGNTAAERRVDAANLVARLLTENE